VKHRKVQSTEEWKVSGQVMIKAKRRKSLLKNTTNKRKKGVLEKAELLLKTHGNTLSGARWIAEEAKNNRGLESKSTLL